MPTYDYECDACEHTFELFQAISAPVQKKCPKCGKLKLRRLFGTGGAIVFKGSGFYKTDYRSDSYQKAAKADGPPPSESGGDASGGKKDSGGKAEGKSSEAKGDSTKSTSSEGTGGSKSKGRSGRRKG